MLEKPTQRRDIVPLVILLVILTAGFWLRLEELPQFWLCPTRKFWGLDCPGCGMTRAFLLLPRGEIRAALALNAGSPLLYGLFWFWALGLAENTFGFRMISQERRACINRVLGVVLVIVLLGHWALKTLARL